MERLPVGWLSLPSTCFHWIRSPPLSSLSQVCPLTVTASRLASLTPQLLCLDFLRLSQSLSVVSLTFSRCLHLSKDLIMLSPPFLRVAHVVAAFPPTFSRCFRLSFDFLTLYQLAPTFSLRVSPTLYKFQFCLTFSLHVWFSFAKKNLQQKLSCTWPWVPFHLKK